MLIELIESATKTVAQVVLYTFIILIAIIVYFAADKFDQNSPTAQAQIECESTLPRLQKCVEAFVDPSGKVYFVKKPE